MSVALALLLLAGNPGTDFDAAISRGDLKAVAALLDAGHPADTPIGEGAGRRTPLQEAAWSGRTAIARLLLERGADPNAPPAVYGTALHAAAARGWDDVVAALLEKGARVDERDERGGRALHSAASNGNRDMAQILIKWGARVEESEPGYTPLMYAAMGDDAEMIRLLAKAGARVDVAAKGEYGGDNPLLLAAQNGRVEAVRALVELKANLNVRTQQGETALDLARAAGHEEIVTILKAAGAREQAPARRKP